MVYKSKQVRSWRGPLRRVIEMKELHGGCINTDAIAY
jgi:hypothetical protein